MGVRRIQGRKEKKKSLTLIGIDPGSITGWAIFKNKVLVKCGHGPLEKAIEATVEHAKWAHVVIESPQYRKYSKASVDDLIRLALRSGELAGLYRSKDAIVELVVPTTWKGSVPKKIHQKRITAVLGNEERGCLEKNHNTMDAVGLGLWRLGRLRR